MISSYIRKRLLGIIREEMIPEYKELIKCKENIKDTFLNFLNNQYLTDRDKKLIEKYPYYINLTNTIDVYPIYYGNYNGEGFLKIKIKYNDYYKLKEFLKISLETPIPKICNYLIDLKEDKDIWNIIGPSVNRYRCTWNSYVEKYDVALDFMLHKNSTLALVKQEFPELYNRYKSCE